MVKKAHFENGPGILWSLNSTRRCPFPLSLVDADTYSTGNYNFIGNYEDEANTAILCNCGQFVSRSCPVNRNVLAELLSELFLLFFFFHWQDLLAQFTSVVLFSSLNIFLSFLEDGEIPSCRYPQGSRECCSASSND